MANRPNSIRHRRWRGEADNFIEREALIASLLGTSEEITQEQVRALTAVLEDLPERLTREEAVFRLPDIVERVGNATAGLLNRDAVATSIERVLLSPEVARLTRPPRSAEGRADMAHTRLYSTRHNLQMEQEVRDMAAGMAAGTGHSLSAQAIEAKVTGLLEAGYPLSEEQIAAIRAVTSSGGRVAIIEGAAGSGKTTTLRPIADLYREHGQSIIATAVAWRTAVALGNDVDVRPFCVDKLLRLAARGGIGINKDTTIIVDEAGMLSTRQAHHILQLSERRGAKIVFAGDTQQQQPVEAGPGLRLIRDAVGSVRVDRIRRQKADIEDILVHVHSETPEAARFRAGLMGDPVALGGAFRETLTRHAVLLKQAAAFRARPGDFAPLLAQRGGIGRKDLHAFEELHARARRHRRAATMRLVHRIKKEAEQQRFKPEIRQGAQPIQDGVVEAAATIPADRIRLRWPGGFVCPCCGHREHCVLAGRGLYQCNRCKKQTSPTAGTIFHATKLPLTLWFAAILSLPFISSAVETLEFCIPTGYLFRHAQDHQHAHLRLPRNRPWPRSASHRNPCPATAGSCPETEKAPAIASEGG